MHSFERSVGLLSVNKQIQLNPSQSMIRLSYERRFQIILNARLETDSADCPITNRILHAGELSVLEVGRYETVCHTGISWRSSNHTGTFLRTK
jgi:hypothetical protein